MMPCHLVDRYHFWKTTLKVEVMEACGTWVPINQIMWCHISGGDYNLEETSPLGF